jgi:hypothetical protein
MKKHFVVIGLLLLLASVVVLALTPVERDEMIKNAKLKREAELQAEREAEQKYGTRTTPTRTTTNTVYIPYTGNLETKIEKNGYFDFLDNEYHKAEIKRLEEKIKNLEKKIETLPLQRQFNTLVNSLAPQIKNLRKENQKLIRQILWLRKIVRDAGLEQKGAPDEVQESNDDPNNLDPNTQDSNSVQ